MVQKSNKNEDVEETGFKAEDVEEADGIEQADTGLKNNDDDEEELFGDIELKCPGCSPQDETWHEIIKSGQSPVARCMDCGQIHSYRVSRPKKKTVKVIVSQMGNTFVLQTTFNEEERYFIGDEIIVDDDATGAAYPIMVTAIETKERRPPSAFVKDIETIWGRAIDEVTVKIAIQDKEITKSVEQKVPGDFSYVVGQNVKIDGKTYPIVSIKVRSGGFKSRTGDSVTAKKIKRVYAKKPKRMYDDGKRY
ncbi:HVO_0476 family zinc finger protein [Methanolapillus millepedarum]|uniref:Uncharacterized protein n=1 Tax=Methanolapillus millepedarum TaxID=3028296 RepID=A0AA96V2J4_9EURY|nr:hypothetical protein MsAc7_08940 [Methanosarcinaceae archaeon Ac7]